MKKCLIFFVCFCVCFTLYALRFTLTRADSTTSAVVPPRASDFQFTFRSDDTNTHFAQDVVRSYTIVYGASESAWFSLPTTITVDYSHDTFNGTHIFDYDTGSASNAYNNTPPIVDTINRTITWNIPSLPPGVTNQIATFKLRSTGNYTGSSSVTTSIIGSMKNTYITFPDSTVNETYTYIPSATTLSPTPTTIPTPTPQPEAGGPLVPISTLSINNVFFNTISDTESEVSVGTSVPAKVSLFYGTNPTSLPSSFATGDFSSFTKVQLTGLSPNTIYYVQVSAVDSNGNKTKSEIFTFRTASSPPTIDLTKSTVIMTSSGNLLNSLSQSPHQNSNSQITLPNTASYQITYTIPQSLSVTSLVALVRNKHILGINTYTLAPQENLIEVPMIEKQPGVYFAELPPIGNSGDYEVFIRVHEKNGNVYEQSVSSITISLPIRILESITNNPVEDARAYFYFYNNTTQKFQPITQEFGAVKNPDFSDKNGYVNSALPKGRYKVVVNALFHSTTTKEFSTLNGEAYPTIYLRKNPYDSRSLATYFYNTGLDILSSLQTNTQNIATIHAFNFFSAIITAVTVMLTFLLFAFKTETTLASLPTRLYHALHHTFLPFQKTIIFGHIFSPSGLPISYVDVFALSEDGKVLYHTTSNGQGGFTYKVKEGATHFQFLHEGYKNTDIDISSDMNTKIILFEKTSSLKSNTIIKVLGEFFGFFFEGFLALSLLLETVFLIHFGVLLTLPFFLLSVCNILLWIFYIKENPRNNIPIHLQE